MPLFPTLERKEEREPISHEVEPHNRPFQEKKLQPKPLVTQRPREEVWAKEYAEATEFLGKQPANVAVQRMQQLPRYLLECYLIAEEHGQARKQVLTRFPKAGKMARERYTPKPVRKSRKASPQAAEATATAEA